MKKIHLHLTKELKSMAKPIAPTPILYGKEAEDFLDKMMEPPSEEKIKFMKEILKNFEKFNYFENLKLEK